MVDEGFDDDVPTKSGRLRARRALVVLDDAATETALRRVLVSAGHISTFARDPAGALAVPDGRRPDIVFIMVGHLDWSGHELAGRLRGSFPEATRFVALARKAGEADRVRARACGFDALLVVPFEVNALLGELAAAQQ